MAEKLTLEQIKQFDQEYKNDPKNAVVENAIANVGIDKSAKRLDVVRQHNWNFSYETKQGKATNQKSSGRCWYFAGLNTLRQITMEKLNVEDFEFSETHLYFYDKLEKANTYLENIIATVDKPLDDREVRLYLLGGGASDGGYWEYFQPLALKYGLVPKSVRPETINSEKSISFVEHMEYRLRRSAMNIRKAHEKGASEDELREIKTKTLSEIYNIAVKALGHPVEKFEFTYKDKDDKYHNEGEFTPIEFMEKYVGREELENRVVLCSDPREIHPYGKVLQSRDKSVYEAPAAGGLNVPIEVLSQAALQSVKDGVPLWFACDVDGPNSRDEGILDQNLYAYDEVLTDLGEFSKADRFASGISSANHAMNITGVEVNAEGEPEFWKVENSWGKDIAKEGTFSMSQEWFLENTYELVVDKKYIPEEYRKGLEEDPIILEPWDFLALSLKI